MPRFLHDRTGIVFEYPENWVVGEQEAVVSVYSKNTGIGVLQFSFYRATDLSKQALREMLVEFLTPRRGEILVEDINGRQHVDLIDKEGTSWQYWLFAGGELVVFATYNCEAKDKGKEDATVLNILQSLEQGET